MQEGDVVLTPVPQADSAVKNRPAVVLRDMPVYRDVLVCGVNTQLQRHSKRLAQMVGADLGFRKSSVEPPMMAWREVAPGQPTAVIVNNSTSSKVSCQTSAETCLESDFPLQQLMNSADDYRLAPHVVEHAVL
jgi:hypothetical protein